MLLCRYRHAFTFESFNRKTLWKHHVPDASKRGGTERGAEDRGEEVEKEEEEEDRRRREPLGGDIHSLLPGRRAAEDPVAAREIAARRSGKVDIWFRQFKLTFEQPDRFSCASTSVSARLGAVNFHTGIPRLRVLRFPSFKQPSSFVSAALTDILIRLTRPFFGSRSF